MNKKSPYKLYQAAAYDLSPDQLPQAAMSVFTKLERAGFLVYLVGGCVRDLLLRYQPKDFDFVTSARPDQIRALFRSKARIIGRRFPLAHVRMQQSIFDVSTFRSGNDSNSLIVRDNQWGTPEEDALRRDLTINALFYHPTSGEIIDYSGGMEDLFRKKLSVIGDPESRFLQDPVRMIRILKLQSRLDDFSIPLKTKQIIKQCSGEIEKSSRARVTEEIFRGLELGNSSTFFDLLSRYGLLKKIFPAFDKPLKKHKKLTHQFLKSVDLFSQQFPKRTLPRSVLLAVLLLPCILSDPERDRGDMLDELFQGNYQIPNKVRTATLQILRLHKAMSKASNRRVESIARAEYFTQAVQILAIRTMTDERLEPALVFWKGVRDELENET
ncbi:polynucleotide adenylyltransferase PcnB [Candidatus Similichlamydia epinepheli]|uniref:polynucleotide adenylyltransferase PcnB n=1 Tax=Candidatus Similichlamydia epinepheli TaxID=1903953 RepID=UPI000D3C6B6F|nr:polynucleotide adenylyltransferase PcnB [Candidatus Similichlamydia epinepheli]